MKSRTVIFNLKGKADIWWEDVKQVRDIKTDHGFLGRSICQKGTMTVRPKKSMN